MTTTKGNAMNIPGYDAWKLASPEDERHEIGHEDGQPCNRVHEPDEDAPRGYRPKPCKGVMCGEYWNADAADAGVPDWIECNTCGEIGETT